MLTSGPAAFAYEETSVSDGGTIQGKIVYQGRVPTRKIIPTKDTEVCGGIRDEPEIIVSADKGVKDAVVYLAEVETGKAWPARSDEWRVGNECVSTCQFRLWSQP